jgi:putative PIN family toxin of toxin-antitoxin system
VPSRPRVVLDTTIVLQAALHPAGYAGLIFLALERGSIEALVSAKLREEYEAVLFRPSVRAASSRLTDDVARDLLDKLYSLATPFDFVPSLVTYDRDPDDEPSLNLGIAARADFLIAWDRDLRDLAATRDFCLLYPYLRIASPEEFLTALQAAALAEND